MVFLIAQVHEKEEALDLEEGIGLGGVRCVGLGCVGGGVSLATTPAERYLHWLSKSSQSRRIWWYKARRQAWPRHVFWRILAALRRSRSR